MTIVFVISLFASLKTVQVGAEWTWKKWGDFLNLFHPWVKQFIESLKQIEFGIIKHKVFVLFKQTCLRK